MTKEQLLAKIQKLRSEIDRYKALEIEAEEVLRGREQWFATTLKSIGDAVITTNNEGVITFMNMVAEVLTGWKLEEVLGKDIAFKIIRKDALRSPENLAPKNPYDDIVISISDHPLLITRAGTEIPVDYSIAPIKDDRGHITGIVVVLRDVSDRKRMEMALRKSEEQYRTLFESLQDVFYRADLKGNIILVSPSFVQLLGYTQDEATHLNLGQNIFARPDQWKTFMTIIEKQGILEGFEVLLKRCDSSVVWVSVTSQLYTGKEGQILGIEGLIRDITERKKDERLLKLNKERLEALVQLHQMHELSAEEIADYVLEKAVELTRSMLGIMNYIIKDNGIVVPSVWSKSVIKRSATEKPAHILMKTTKIWAEALRQRTPIILNDYPAVRSAKNDELEEYVELKRVLAIPVFDEDTMVLISAVANKEENYDETDVNELTLLMNGMWNHIKAKLAAKALQQAKEDTEAANAQLQELNASKDTFFSIIAHDLRNPLSSLHELTQIIEENLDHYSPDELKEMIVLQKTAAENLYKLLENLLTWSRVQRGVISYEPQPIDTRRLVARNVALLALQAERKQITLTSSIREGTVIYADFNMADTVIRNLISNAIKYTFVGGTVNMSARQDDHSVEVSVSDTGIGIEEEHIPKLFRIDAKYKQLGTNREEGTGLGLILCKEFVERHGGKIWVESQVGKGTTFRFTLPKATGELLEAQIAHQVKP
jgi:two-component system phosphate regulon sensor histidine kinase PhoR